MTEVYGLVSGRAGMWLAIGGCGDEMVSTRKGCRSWSKEEKSFQERSPPPSPPASDRLDSEDHCPSREKSGRPHVRPLPANRAPATDGEDDAAGVRPHLRPLPANVAPATHPFQT
ncbi:hypothetical protein LWI29_007144 [Acer saccharum]|uniref:Uncharacterized protein n=1 Tax=Acer saccharum TaxID=4024 RepID=A0AA39UQC6_ACESA|nr:hypothetical protein LWI29_007144 [Acer saccharum]